MQMVLAQLNSVPGVVGSMVCDNQGQVIAHVFPSLFDASMLTQAARVLADSTAGLETVTGSVRLLDLRFDDARIVVRPLSRATLLFLCSASINLQPLAISTSVAAPKIERILAGGSAAGSSGLGLVVPGPGSSGIAAATPVVAANISGLGWSTPDGHTPPPSPLPPQLQLAPPAPEVSEISEVSELFTTLEKIDAIIARRGLDKFKVRGAIAMKAGFGLGSIDADSPNDPRKLASLKAAAAAVLGEKV
jgi:predicted regulator of Ras-like GTPase activity (Roadblock/LC7/MglB family)